MTDTYAVTDVPAERFEAAIADAREEGNLSRANVVRTVLSAGGVLPPCCPLGA